MKGKAFGLIATERRKSFCDYRACILSGRGSPRRANARGRRRVVLATGVVSGDKR